MENTPLFCEIETLLDEGSSNKISKPVLTDVLGTCNATCSLLAAVCRPMPENDTTV